MQAEPKAGSACLRIDCRPSCKRLMDDRADILPDPWNSLPGRIGRQDLAHKMSERQTMRGRRYWKPAVWIAGIGLVVSLGVYLAGNNRKLHDAAEVYRIGWESDPPFQQPGANGEATGFAVDIVREAAKRRGIRLDWINSQAGSESSLRQGLVDLWPLMTITPERTRVLHLTDPYMQHDHYLVVRANSNVAQARDLSGRDGEFAWHARSPGASRAGSCPVPRSFQERPPTEAIRDVCTGSSAAALLEGFAVISTLLAGLTCPNQPLRAIWVPELQTTLGVGSTFRASSVADEIREEISAMGQDGSLARLMTKWGYYYPRNLETTNALLNAGRVQRRLVVSVAVFALLSLVALVSLLHIRGRGTGSGGRSPNGNSPRRR